LELERIVESFIIRSTPFLTKYENIESFVHLKDNTFI